MDITRFSLLHKPVIFMAIILLTIMGLMSYNSLPRESSPSITIPLIIVTTPYIGVAPGDMETLVTLPLEKKLKEITDVKVIRSTSAEGISSIQVEFNPETDIDEALQKVREKVDLAKAELPADAEDPVINEINFSDFPIMLVNISGNYGLVKLKDVAEELEDRFETIPGVLDVNITGGLEREVKVNVDLAKLKYYNISFKDITDAIHNENQTIPGGSLEVGKLKYLIRIPGEFEEPDIIKDLVVKVMDGTPIFIRDIAEVVYGFKDRESYARQNGRECITLSVQKRSGENLIRIAQTVKAEIAAALPQLPAGTHIDILADQSKEIHRMVNELENNIIAGLLLVVIVLFFFLGGRNAAFVAISIPLSMLISFLVIDILGYTLNMVILFSLILALGMLVDNAIVIIENIYRHREEGYSPMQAAFLGTKEVSGAVTASTVTTLCAFSPMLFWPGIMGEFMSYLPATLIITLTSCLFVALVFNPVIAAQFMVISKKEKTSSFEHLMNKVVDIYEKALRFVLNWRGRTLGISFANLVLFIILYGFVGKGCEFMPAVDPAQLYIDVTAPTGTNLDESNVILKSIEKDLPQFLGDVKSFTTNVGYAQAMNLGEGSSGGTPHKSRVTLEFIDQEDREQSSKKTKDQIRDAIKGQAGARIEVNEPEMGPPTGPPVNIEIAGDDFTVLGNLAEKIQRIIRKIDGIVDLRDDYDKGRPELRIVIDREKASLYGLNTQKIAGMVRTAINGSEASTFRVNEEEYDITVRLNEKWRDQITDIDQLVAFEEGTQIPLTSIAKIEFSTGLANILHKDRKRVVTVSANTEGRLPNEILAEVQDSLAIFPLPPGYNISYTGENEEQEKTMAFLSKAFFIAIFLIFIVLVYQFNSVATPFIIMFSVILSLIGVLIGLMITRTPFGIMMTGIGVISLAGVVVNNAIVLLDYTIKLRERGYAKLEAIVKAGRTRFRPVILTAVTTILGLIPLTTGLNVDFFNFSFSYGGQNQQWWGPMGIAVIFGLAFATFLTLIVVPVAYSLFDDSTRWFHKITGRERETLDDPGNGKASLPQPELSEA